MSALGQKRTHAAQQKDRYSITSSARARTVGGIVRPSALASFKIDHQLVFIRRLHWQISWLLTLEDAVDVSGRPAELCKNIIPIRGQPAVDGKDAPVVDRGQSVPRRKRNYKALMDHRPRTRRQDQTAIRRVSKFGDLALNFTGIAHANRTHLHTN